MRTYKLIAGLLSLALVGCSGDASPVADGGATGGTVIINMGADANGIFPLLANVETSRAVTDQVFDRLAQIPEDLNTVGDAGYTPRLASSWEWASDSLSIAFHLNPRARWHDGQPVRASDVAFTFALARDSALGSPVRDLLGNVDSVSVRDSLTAVVWFKGRSAEQFYDAVYQAPIVPEHVYGKVPAGQLGASELMRSPVGSGRFRMAKWDVGARIELHADSANYRGRPKLDRVVLNIVPDPMAAGTQVLTGDADMYQAFPMTSLASLDSNPRARGIPYATMGYVYLGFNLRDRKNPIRPHPLFGDIRVRRAMAMAVDRRAMLENVFGKYGQLGHGPFPSSIAVADTSIPLPPYDTLAASALLDSAGWLRGSDGTRQKAGQPLGFSILAVSSSAPRSRYAILIQEQLRRIGVTVTIESMPPPTFFPRQNQGDFDAATVGLVGDPSISGLAEQWGSRSVAPAGLNYVGFRNPAVDALLDSAGRATNLSALKGLASRAYGLIIADVPGIWLYDLVSVTALDKRIEPRPFRSIGWWVDLDEWSIPPDKRIDRDRIGLGAPQR